MFLLISIFFVTQKTAYDMRISDWSSDVFSSDLIFLVFTGTSIALAFVSAAAVFAGMSLWGYTTNVDLSRWSTFLMVGLIGVVIASLVNLFVGSSTRSDERRVGKEVVSQCRSRWAPCH